MGGGQNLHLKDFRQHPAQLYSYRRLSPISRFAANRDPDSRFPAESGNGPFPDSRFPADRESGIPSQFPGQIGNRGNGNWGFPGPVSRSNGAAQCAIVRSIRTRATSRDLDGRSKRPKHARAKSAKRSKNQTNPEKRKKILWTLGRTSPQGVHQSNYVSYLVFCRK